MIDVRRIIVKMARWAKQEHIIARWRSKIDIEFDPSVGKNQRRFAMDRVIRYSHKIKAAVIRIDEI